MRAARRSDDCASPRKGFARRSTARPACVVGEVPRLLRRLRLDPQRAVACPAPRFRACVRASGRLNALVDRAAENDRCSPHSKPGSLIVNTTGLGKDAPGSPLTAARPSRTRRRLGAQLSGRPRPSRAGARRRMGAQGRGWVDLFHPWLDAGHRGGVRRRHLPHRARRSTPSPASRAR